MYIVIDYDPRQITGAARYQEDRLIPWLYQEPYIAGTLDGMSPLYNPRDGAKKKGVLSYGQVIGSMVVKAFARAKTEDTLPGLLLRANDQVRSFVEAEGLSITDSHLLPSLSFALVQLDYLTCRILVGGDCWVAVRKKSGEYVGSENRAYKHEVAVETLYRDFMQQHQYIEDVEERRSHVWDHQIPIESSYQLAHINKAHGYASINGQPELPHYWQNIEIPLEEIDIIMVGSDGWLSLEDTTPGKEKEYAQRMIELYGTGGWDKIIEHKTPKELAQAQTSWHAHPEASGFVIQNIQIQAADA